MQSNWHLIYSLRTAERFSRMAKLQRTAPQFESCGIVTAYDFVAEIDFLTVNSGL